MKVQGVGWAVLVLKGHGRSGDHVVECLVVGCHCGCCLVNQHKNLLLETCAELVEQVVLWLRRLERSVKSDNEHDNLNDIRFPDAHAPLQQPCNFWLAGWFLEDGRKVVEPVVGEVLLPHEVDHKLTVAVKSFDCLPVRHGGKRLGCKACPRVVFAVLPAARVGQLELNDSKGTWGACLLVPSSTNGREAIRLGRIEFNAFARPDRRVPQPAPAELAGLWNQGVAIIVWCHPLGTEDIPQHAFDCFLAHERENAWVAPRHLQKAKGLNHLDEHLLHLLLLQAV
mmetsp:Transcript_40564/g.94892  ORF Transcript_40564/g.94892 Transcript_40564/m.94892 type:complete len:283 (-) Transcript_40564:822-1670(-)